MIKEILEQNTSLHDTFAKWIKEDSEVNIDLSDIEELILCSPINRVILVACGTAWHAALIGKYAFEHFARIPAEAITSSEFRYSNPVFSKNEIVIFVSQSGETADTLAALRIAKENGAKIIVITNVIGSTLAREADVVVPTLAGAEFAVASTKAFTAQIMTIILICLKISKSKGRIDQHHYYETIKSLQQIAAKVTESFSLEDEVRDFARSVLEKSKYFFIGRQFDYPVSLEASLKLKELTYAHCEAFPAGELKHGPIALVDKSTLVFAICTQRALFSKMVANIKELLARGAAISVITYKGEHCFDANAEKVFYIPNTQDDISPLLSIIPFHFFAYYSSIMRGNNPDRPRNLAKSVTVE